MSADHPSMLRPGHAVALCVLALLMIGVVMVNSAGMTIRTREPFTIEAILLSKSTLYAGIAMLALIACSMLPLRRLIPARAGTDAAVLNDPAEPAIDEPLLSPAWFRALIGGYIRLWPLWLAAAALIGLLATVYVPGIRSPKNGSHRWINLHLPGLESVQPSELAKWGLVLLIGAYAACSLRRMGSFWLGLVPGLVATGLVTGVVVIEDLGTGALMAAAACVVLLAAGARVWHLLILCPVPVAGAVLAIVTNPYRVHRIESFMNPFLDPQGKGFHMIQSMSAISGGGVFGRGLGGGLQKFGYLPEDTTDFIFATICEELGVAGAAVVVFLLGALVWSIWGIVRRENVAALKLLGLGVMATVGIQALINLAVVTGLGPTKGIALPLISSGGTGWILTAAAIGLVVAIDHGQTADLRRGARRRGEPDASPEGYAMPTLGAMAVGAAAAAGTLPEIKPDAEPQAMVEVLAAQDEDSEELVASAGVAADEGTVGDELFADDDDSFPAHAELLALVTEPVAAAHQPGSESGPEESVEAMFAGAVIADPPPPRDLPVVLTDEAGADTMPEASSIMIEPKSDTAAAPAGFANLPGEAGLLFDPHVRSPETPSIVVTDAARGWLRQSIEESAA